MYSPREILNREPAVIGGAVAAVLNVLVLLGVVQLDPDQLAGINTAVVMLVALFVRQSVTPTSQL